MGTRSWPFSMRCCRPALSICRMAARKRCMSGPFSYVMPLDELDCAPAGWRLFKLVTAGDYEDMRDLWRLSLLPHGHPAGRPLGVFHRGSLRLQRHLSAKAPLRLDAGLREGTSTAMPVIHLADRAIAPGLRPGGRTFPAEPHHHRPCRHRHRPVEARRAFGRRRARSCSIS